jgi:multidrug efflux pump subunit AcrA (membrane-fusion protein)
VEPGDRVTIRFDALPHREFSAVLARIAHSEMPETRTMLAEVDLPNTDDAIRDHMYGRVEIELGSPLAGVTVPSACLVGDTSAGKSQLFVVIDGHAKLRQVQVGKDSGVLVEVLSGLSEAEEVVVRPPGGLVDGAEVTTAKSDQAEVHVSHVGR